MIEPVDDPGDPRIADYVGLTDPQLRMRVEAGGGFFVVEGVLAIERLLAAPSYRPRSFLLTPKALEKLGDAPLATGVPVYVADMTVLEQVVGFNLHRGAVASVERPAPMPWRSVASAERLLVVEGVNDHENLGGLFRNAAAFGVGGVLLDPTCADPLYRRAVRVSMGHVLGVPFARVDDWPAALSALDATVVALTLAPDAVDLRSVAVPAGRVAVLVGAEGPGLTPAAQAAATIRARIPMAPGVDSLNVATAAAIALHHLAG